MVISNPWFKIISSTGWGKSCECYTQSLFLYLLSIRTTVNLLLHRPVHIMYNMGFFEVIYNSLILIFMFALSIFKLSIFYVFLFSQIYFKAKQWFSVPLYFLSLVKKHWDFRFILKVSFFPFFKILTQEYVYWF